MSSNNSLPRVRQRVEESVANRRLCMEKQQVLSERNLLRVDLRDPIQPPIGQIIQETSSNMDSVLFQAMCLVASF
jgi:hypothetical protein